MGPPTETTRASLSLKLERYFTENGWSNEQHPLKEILQRLISACDTTHPTTPLSEKEILLLQRNGVEKILIEILTEIGIACSECGFDDTEENYRLRLSQAYL